MNCWNTPLLESGTGAAAGVKVHNIAGIGVWVSLFLVRVLPASLFLPPGGRLRQGLQQACGSTIALIEK